MAGQPFWETKKLDEMTAQEWESLCDGCGRCCLVKLEDEDNGDVFFTDVACKLLDHDSSQCTHYSDRHNYVSDCVVLTPKLVASLEWLPQTCAYRLISEGESLFPWHPLISGDPRSIHHEGISVRGCTVSELDVPEEELEERVIHWVT